MDIQTRAVRTLAGDHSRGERASKISVRPQSSLSGPGCRCSWDATGHTYGNNIGVNGRHGHGFGRGGGFFGQKMSFYPVLVQKIFSPLRGENVFFWRSSILSSVNFGFLVPRGV